MNRKEGGSISTRSNLISLQELARWNQEKRIGRRTTHNKENVVNRQYHVPQSRLEQAIVDYASGQFRFKKTQKIKLKPNQPRKMCRTGD